MKLLLMGSVLMEGSYEPSLSLEDFITGEKVTTGSSPSPDNNVGLISVLKNLQLVLQIVVSDVFGSCLDNFSEDLECALRPLELIATDSKAVGRAGLQEML
jgi:hypothetical protein